MNIQAIEHASFQALPALEEQNLPYVTLRYAEGYSKRVNSASLKTGSRIAVNDLIHTTENFFQERQLDSVIRVLRLSGCGFSELDDQLAHHDYQLVAPTHVMTLPLQPLNEEEQVHFNCQSNPSLVRDLSCGSVHEVNPEQWLTVFSALVTENEYAKQAHESVLKRVPNTSMFQIMHDAHGNAVACGFAVASEAYVGFFNIAVARQHRGRGYGHQLMKSLLAWARKQEAHCAYLQVEQSNVAAVRLYEKLNFRKHYQYWYRVKPNPLKNNPPFRT